MKIELKRDDPSLKDIHVELDPGYYHDQSQWGYATKISVLELVEFYERWVEVINKLRTMTYMKNILNSIYGNVVELEKIIGGDEK